MQKELSLGSSKQTILGIAIPSAFILAYLGGNYLNRNLNVQFVENMQVNHILIFQIYGLILSLSLLVLTIRLNPESKKLLRFGNLQNGAKAVNWLGIKEGESWFRVAASFLIVITLVTTLFMYMGLGDKVDWTKLIPLLPFILLFSLTNSFSEEIITRFSVVGLLQGVMKPSAIMMASALIFGLPHYFGNPGGPVGVIMAGFLGWILAKSILETKGIGVAWGVHFFQDIVIYSFLLIANDLV
jgi:uncharacterized protein